MTKTKPDFSIPYETLTDNKLEIEYKGWYKNNSQVKTQSQFYTREPQVVKYVENSDCNTEFTVIKNGKVVSSDKIEKAKFQEQNGNLFDSHWDNFKAIFGR